jgi:hypothetical protein
MQKRFSYNIMKKNNDPLETPVYANQLNRLLSETAMKYKNTCLCSCSYKP